MKINSNQFTSAAWRRVGVALASGALVVGCGGGGGGTSRPNASAGEIVFVSDREVPNASSDLKLFRANLDGSNLTYIPTSVGTRPFSSPEWFVGRQEVIYTNYINGGRGGIDTSTRRVNRDGTNDREIPLPDTNGIDVSPDGNQLVYAAYGPPFGNGQLDFEIFIADIDGTNSRSIAKGSQPSWSPDGRRITYVATVEEPYPNDIFRGTPSVFVMNADGTNQTRLTTALGSNMNPQFSPDGKRIVYEFTPFEFDPVTGIQTKPEIFVMNANGSSQTKITNFAGTDGDFDPKWTPDSRRIVFLSRSGIRVMNADGSDQKPLFNEPIRVIDFDIR